jgi:hypothetical protein
MAYAKGSSTKATRGLIPVLYSPLILPILDVKTVAVECVSRDYEGEFSGGGDLISIRDFSGTTINVNDYTVDGTTLSYQTTGENYIDMVVDQQKYTAFKIDDIDRAQTDLGVMEANAERAAIAMRNTVDTFLQSTMAAGAHADNIIGGAGSGSVKLVTPENVYDLFNDMFTRLEEANADSLGGTPFALVPPSVMGVIRKSPELKSQTAAGDEVIRKGFRGMFAQFMLKESTNIPYNQAGTGTEPYFNIIYGYKTATQFVMQIMQDEDLTLQTTFAEANRKLAVYGGKVTIPKALGRAVVKV